jgi:hypothetical protein
LIENVPPAMMGKLRPSAILTVKITVGERWKLLSNTNHLDADGFLLTLAGVHDLAALYVAALHPLDEEGILPSQREDIQQPSNPGLLTIIKALDIDLLEGL